MDGNGKTMIGAAGLVGGSEGSAADGGSEPNTPAAPSRS